MLRIFFQNKIFQIKCFILMNNIDSLLHRKKYDVFSILIFIVDRSVHKTVDKCLTQFLRLSANILLNASIKNLCFFFIISFVWKWYADITTRLLSYFSNKLAIQSQFSNSSSMISFSKQSCWQITFFHKKLKILSAFAAKKNWISIHSNKSFRATIKKLFSWFINICITSTVIFFHKYEIQVECNVFFFTNKITKLTTIAIFYVMTNSFIQMISSISINNSTIRFFFSRCSILSCKFFNIFFFKIVYYATHKNIFRIATKKITILNFEFKNISFSFAKFFCVHFWRFLQRHEIANYFFRFIKIFVFQNLSFRWQNDRKHAQVF